MLISQPASSFVVNTKENEGDETKKEALSEFLYAAGCRIKRLHKQAIASYAAASTA